MVTVNEQFNSIDKSIRNAQHKRTIMLVERRARKYLTGFQGPEVKSDIKEKAKERFDKSMKLAEERKKNLPK